MSKVIEEYLNRIEKGVYTVKDGKLLKGSKELGSVHRQTGYKMVGLAIGKAYLHRLLYAYYHGYENLNPDLSINHIDGNKLNNEKHNLEQISLADNTRHQWKTGLRQKGSDCSYAKLDEQKVREIKKVLAEGTYSQYKLADIYGVSRSTILNIKLGNTWKDVL